MNVLVFDIETIPDVETGRTLLDLGDVPDEDAARAMAMALLPNGEAGRRDFMRHHLHKIVAVSAVFRSADRFKCWSLGTPEDDEAALLRHFFDGIERYTPMLVSWNGSGFDLPVIHYRALAHGVAAPRYWDTGRDDRDFKWNNYLSRYHERHTDLMDVLAAYQPRAAASLDQIAVLCGLPGKVDMSGSDVFKRHLAGDLKGIRDYCETDVLNTYLVYLRFEFIRGHLTESAYADEVQRVRDFLRENPEPHFTRFAEVWAARGA